MILTTYKTWRLMIPLLGVAVLSLWLSACSSDPISSDDEGRKVGTVDSTDTVEIGPRLELSEDSFEFGYAPQYSTVSHVFWLHSTGDDTLRILRIAPG